MEKSSSRRAGGHAPKILVVEDEADIRTVIVHLLRRAGYRALEAADGAVAVRLVATEQPALAILDVNMPEMGGFAALETIRRRGSVMPILMLSSHAEVDRRVKGLGLGADDYMAKPFDERELLGRVEALLRRGTPTESSKPLLRHGDVTIDLAGKCAERAGELLPLTATEFAILEVLARDIGQPVSKDRLLDAVWGYTVVPNTRTVETHIWRLRKKLGDETGEGGWIQNRSGLGYMLTKNDAAPLHVVEFRRPEEETSRAAMQG